MECPKCHSHSMRQVATIIASSSLIRHTGDAKPWAEGYSCPLCGYWSDMAAAPAPAVTIAEAVDKHYVPQKAPVWSTFIEPVRPLHPDLKMHRSAGMGWEMCAKLVRFATKSNIQAKQLMRVYQALESERPIDEGRMAV